MLDWDKDRNLQRGDQIHIDCSTSERISAVSYQQTAKADVPPYLKKGRKLEISCQLPATHIFGAATAQASCATEAGDTATFSAALEAHPGPLSTSASINKPGTTSTEFELTSRAYALLLRRLLQSKLQCGSTLNSPFTKYTSSAEVAVPDLTGTFSCKANATTDFRQRLVLHGELQWHAKRRQARTTSPFKADTTKGGKAFGPKWHSKLHSNTSQHMQTPQATWYSSSAAHLPWLGQCMQYPSPVYAHKARLANWGHATGTGIKGFEADKDLETTDEAQAGRGPSNQCTFQLKGSAEGKPPPTWQIRGQKALGAKLQLRVQAGAALGMAHLLPSRWQLEIKHKLRKGAMLNMRLQKDERRSSQQCDRYRVQVEHKACTHWVTCMWAQEASGCQVGVKAKTSSGKRKFTDNQHWHVSLNASVHLGSPAGLKPKFKAEISTAL
ncbi:TPA: hypothetical protein ACH3X1_014931 [Trebouxia sp. C0004]